MSDKGGAVVCHPDDLNIQGRFNVIQKYRYIYI